MKLKYARVALDAVVAVATTAVAWSVYESGRMAQVNKKLHEQNASNKKGLF